MKRIAILGSTGSIGRNTLKVANHLKEHFQVTALAAHSDIDLLEQQAKQVHPELIALFDAEKAKELKKRLPSTEIVSGEEGLLAVATHSNVDMVVSAIVGTAGFPPTIAAIRAGKDLALANKEALVSGGALIMCAVKEAGVNLIPIDSEHSALFQCLNGESQKELKRVILTASGGPFQKFSQLELNKITVEQALNHPTWKMGPKVTIDSSTLMNKGLEVIEAHWLFNLPVSQIEVVIHPQSFIHSMVEFIDHSIIAQMGNPDMITPIQYALTYPQRMKSSLSPFDFTKEYSFTFLPPDLQRFRCLKLAYDSIKVGKSLSCFMNGANEVLVSRFLNHQIPWSEISTKLETLMNNHNPLSLSSVETVLAVDEQARLQAKTI